jgi:HK97 family phage portal protein
MEIYVAGAKKESPKQSRVVSTKALSRDLVQTYLGKDVPQLTKKYNQFWDLMDVIEQHGYLKSSISAVGRGALGAWWTIAEHPLYMGKGDESTKEKLYEFYSSNRRNWDNIKDFQSMAYKIVAAAMYLKYFGQAAFYIVRNKRGTPISLDFLHGLIVPNVDSEGYFKSPAFYQFKDRQALERIDFSADEVVFISNPDMRGNPMGGSDAESLTTFSLPTDIYLMAAARNYLQNADNPEAIWELPEDVTDEAFNEFAEVISKRYRGATNAGKNPIVVAGELNYKELRRMPEDLPYADSRDIARNEVIATSGSSAVKLGLADGQSQANAREFRQEFLESTLVPVFKMIEVAFYEQIHRRQFGIKEWMFKFEHPDFLTAVERATVHMRYIQTGVKNPNEVRAEEGLAPREGGEEYVDVTAQSKAGNEQGSPPEGREDRPDKPSNTGEPTLDDQDPPRGDQHDEPNRPRSLSPNIDKDALIDELYTMRDFTVGRVKKEMSLREFKSDILPEDVRQLANDFILSRDWSVEDIDEIKEYFNSAIDLVKESE